MANQIVPNCLCVECGNPMDVQRQADGKGGFYWIVTCWVKDCLMATVTRSLETYVTLSPAEIETYRETNRKFKLMAVLHE